MAEIRVQPRAKNRSWIWILLLLIVLAAVAYYLWSSGRLGGTSAPATVPATAPAPTAPAGPPPSSARDGTPVRVATLVTTSTGGHHGTAR